MENMHQHCKTKHGSSESAVMRLLARNRCMFPTGLYHLTNWLILTFGNLPDDASRGAIRDMIVELKRSALEIYSREGIEPADITVDTPIPFSIHQMWLDLHREVNATHTVASTGQSRATEALLVETTERLLKWAMPWRLSHHAIVQLHRQRVKARSWPFAYSWD